jgi:co-chaperonin GroES (HSP10)
MNIQPNKDTLLIEAYDYTSKEKSAIYLAGGDNDTSVEAFNQVLDCHNDNVAGVKKGDIILVDKNTGFFFQIDGKKYRIILYTQVLAHITGIEKEQTKRKKALENKQE